MKRFKFLCLCTSLLTFAITASISLATPAISEFMAANDSALADEDGDFPDWIEIHNPDGSAVNLDGYYLTDKADNLTKWRVPAVSIPANGYLVVFASNKDRVDPAGELHTNFKLVAEGGYLALVAPDGVTVLTDFGETYPPQFEDQSYGRDTFGSVVEEQLINGSVPAKFLVPSDDSLGDSWQAAPGSFDDSSWTATTTGIGFDSGSAPLHALVGDINLDLRTQMQTVNGSCYIRVPFTYSSANQQIQTLTLSVNCDDGFVAYINGVEVGSFNKPGGLTWDSTASGSRGDTTVLSTPIVVDATVGAAQVQDGENILAIQGMNSTTTGSDFLIYPELIADVVDTSGSLRDGYFDSPTPGLPNSSGQAAGPLLLDFTDKPERPAAGEDLVITTTTGEVASPVSSVKLFYRVMFGTEVELNMTDDGTGADAAPGDGIYTTAIPGSAFDAGEMIRWRFLATDQLGLETKNPAFKDPLDSHEYVGTVALDPSVNTNLSVVEWFVQNPSAANNTTPGARGAVFYLGELYDNVYFNRHGQSTGGFPKKSYNMDFNKTQRFQWSEDAPRVKDIDLITNWADKSKVRHVLAYEIMRNAGVHAHFAYTVRVQQNGEFFSTADIIEDADEIWLKRTGLNQDGALYKAYSNTLSGSANSGFEKKNRRGENNDDLQALINGLALSGTALDNFTFDNVNIPMTVNMMAAAAVIRNTDMHSKNWYIYRDTGVTDEWGLLPWDLDLSQGRYWRSQFNYFSNLLEFDNFVQTGGSVRLVSQLYSRPSTRDMFYRRVRTLMDLYMQPADTPLAERWYERRMDEQLALVDPDNITPSDAQLDFEKWGSWLHNADGGGATVVPYTSTEPDSEHMREGVARLRDEYLPARRNYIYNSVAAIPEPQTGQLSFVYTPLLEQGAPVQSLVPSDASVDGIWQEFGFDDSNWVTGTTGIGFDSGPKYEPFIGTDTESLMRGIHPTVYMRCEFEVPDPSIYQALELRMLYDDGFIVYLNGVQIAEQSAPASPAWNSIATSGAEAVVDPVEWDIYNVSAHVGQLRAGTNVLAIHGMNQSSGSSDLLILPEFFGGTADSNGSVEPKIDFGTIEFSPASGNQDEEYVELVNNNSIAVDISNWKVDGGIDFEIPAGTVIPAGWSLYLSPNAAAFRARAQSPTGGEGNFVVSAYKGHLSSLGETLVLTDQFGLENNATSYVGDPSDAQRYLVVSEIMYHPEPDGDAEYIELMNISDSVTLDLTGVRFTNGIDFDFTGSSVTSLAPGARVLVVRNLAAFETAHGAGLPVAGIFANLSSLDNAGETIKLEDADNGTIKEFRYNDRAPWPVAADTLGYSIVLIAPATNPDPGEPTNWRASAAVGGTPGGSDATSFAGNATDDLDGDGLNALVEHALGSSDNDPSPSGNVASAGQGEFNGMMHDTFTYTVSGTADDTSHLVQTTTDLLTWTTDAADVIEVFSSPNGDGTVTRTVRLAEPSAGEAKRYFRLLVELK